MSDILYTVYRTTNAINGKIYVGTHRTRDINDDYLGSGKNIKRAIKKYGIENFIKETLFVFDNAKDMFQKEKEIVDREFCMREDTYNINNGGLGGWAHLFDIPHSEETKRKISEAHKKYWSKNPDRRMSDEQKRKISAIHLGRKHPPRSEIQKERMSKARKEYFANNPEAKKILSEKKKQYYKDNPEAKIKLSESRKRYAAANPVSAETRKKISESTRKHHTGMKRSEEARANMRKAQLLRFQDPKERDKLKGPRPQSCKGYKKSLP